MISGGQETVKPKVIIFPGEVQRPIDTPEQIDLAKFFLKEDGCSADKVGTDSPDETACKAVVDQFLATNPLTQTTAEVMFAVMNYCGRSMEIVGGKAVRYQFKDDSSTCFMNALKNLKDLKQGKKNIVHNSAGEVTIPGYLTMDLTKAAAAIDFPADAVTADLTDGTEILAYQKNQSDAVVKKKADAAAAKKKSEDAATAKKKADADAAAAEKKGKLSAFFQVIPGKSAGYVLKLSGESAPFDGGGALAGDFSLARPRSIEQVPNFLYSQASTSTSDLQASTHLYFKNEIQREGSNFYWGGKFGLMEYYNQAPGIMLSYGAGRRTTRLVLGVEAYGGLARFQPFAKGDTFDGSFAGALGANLEGHPILSVENAFRDLKLSLGIFYSGGGSTVPNLLTTSSGVEATFQLDPKWSLTPTIGVPVAYNAETDGYRLTLNPGLAAKRTLSENSSLSLDASYLSSVSRQDVSSRDAGSSGSTLNDTATGDEFDSNYSIRQTFGGNREEWKAGVGYQHGAVTFGAHLLYAEDEENVESQGDSAAYPLHSETKGIFDITITR